MGKNKKPAINPYSCFMDDFEKQHGRKYNSRQELAEAAGPHWMKLSKDQRKVYEEKAKMLKGEGAKYTSRGVKIDVVLEQDNQEKLKEQEMKNDIKSLVSLLVESNEIATHTFHIIHVNEFCYCNAMKQFIPAEIAIVAFNFQDGVIEDNVLHFIVQPGALPLGYSADAKQKSDETHQLPIPVAIDKVEDNRPEVTEAIFKFLRRGMSRAETFPPLYCDPKYTEVAENVMTHFLLDYGCSEDMIKIHSLEFLFYTLRNEIPRTIVWQSITLSRLELDRDVFDYCKGIACDYHENSDVPNHCSRSRAIRLAYIICENCCPDLQIELIPGQHIPAKSVAVNAPSVRQTDTSSVYSDYQDDYNTGKLDFLSVRSESRLSIATDFTSFPEKENASIGGFDFGLSQTSQSSSNWRQVKPRRQKNNPTFEPSDPVTSFPSEFEESEQLSFNSALSSSQSQPPRIPLNPPAALAPQFNKLSLNDDQRAPGERPPSTSSSISKGRGRGSLLWSKGRNN